MEDQSYYWIAQFIGRLHPLVVHFPIGLLVVALGLEMLTLNGRKKELREGIYWLVLIGALSSVLAAVFGLILLTADDYQGELVDRHLLWGILTAALSLATFFLLTRQRKQQNASLFLYRSGLGMTVFSLILAGHFGASLTHGEDFLSSTFPWRQEQPLLKADNLLTELTSSPSASLSEAQLDRLNLEVRAIFAHNCYQCHSELKKKGELILETREGVMKGGKTGPLFAVGNSGQSEIIRRLKLPRDHKEAMPGKGKALEPEEIELISLWIDQGAHWADESLKVFPEAALALHKPELPPAGPGSNHPVDRIIAAYFEKHNLKMPVLVDDRTFIRRAFLDVIGLLPTPQQVNLFLEDKNPDKRDALVEKLLADQENYTQHWLSFWNDLLRNDYSGTGFITGGRKQITDWLYQAIAQNKPYNQMVRELTNPGPESEGFIKGIQWRGVVNASQRTEMQAAQNISQSLLGINLKCASCHNSFVSNLTLDQAYGFANIFADSALEINRCDQPTGKMASTAFLYPELGEVEAATIKERLKKLSDVMVNPENGRLYRTIVNRIWQRLIGRGIIEPLDEMDNPPWSAELLDWLAADFIEHGYDLKHLIRRIMTSQASQLPAVRVERMEELLREDYRFTGPMLRRLSAEQFADAISQVVAPVYHSLAFDPYQEELDAEWIWHREVEVERDILPKPGTRYFRRSFELPDELPQSAMALITADHSFSLFLNGERVTGGKDWHKVQKVDFRDYLKLGTNLIAVEAENEGSIPNPAGLLFSLKMEFSDGERQFLHSDRDWKTTREKPDQDWITSNYQDLAWEPVKVIGSRNATGYWGKLIRFSFDPPRQEFARASLVKLDPFLKALGRPSRENVTTSRDNQATLLQALELTNGTFFNEVMEAGATLLLDKHRDNPKQLYTDLYLRAFGREPNKDEASVIDHLLGKNPGPEAVQDLLWSVVLLPEFQFIN